MREEKDNAGIHGDISWKVIDLKTNKILRENKKHNLITDKYAESIASALVGGSIMEIDQMQIGTTNTSFTEASSGLTSVLQTLSVTGVKTAKAVKYEETFVFTAPTTIEEIGLIDSGAAWAIALSSAISEGMNANQALAIEWTIHHDN